MTFFIHVNTKMDSIIFKQLYCKHVLHDGLHKITLNVDYTYLFHNLSLPIIAQSIINRCDVLIGVRVSGHGLNQCLLNSFEWNF